MAAISAALAVGPAGLATAGASAATSGPATAPAAAVNWPTIRQGAKGERVRTIQYLLTARGFREPADGIYGKDTTATVKRFQKASKLSADGSVGPSTWPKLVVEVRRGSKGSAVTALQRQLRFTFGYKSVVVDGSFGAATQVAVKNFQSKKGLKADGIVGQGTWKALVS
ncbi:MAG TPA: peptidoglycan-binding protein [Solirubrobacteraceae bacterium]|nr:peptidoglycan-binding protein [Solirubrobacteraceae bacterium]